MDTKAFVEKFLSRLDRLDREQVESFVGRLLRESDLLEAVLNELRDGVVVVDSHGKVLRINAAARAFLDVEDTRRGVGNRFLQLLQGDRFQSLRLMVERYNREGKPIENERVVVFLKPRRTYEITAVAVDSGDTGASNTLWVIHDSGKQQRRRDEEARARYVHFLATLTAGLAHEIRNPLNSLSIHSSLIQQGLKELPPNVPADDVDRLKRSADILTEELLRLNRIVDQFLAAARPVKLDPKPTRIDGVFTQIVYLLGLECRERSIDLVVESDPELPPLPVDAGQIHQVLLNLTKNAMEAIGTEGRIVLRSHLERDSVLIEVSDTGAGIPEEDRSRIFEPYYSTKKTGSGLGLMVVWRIVQAHGGAIAVESREGEGTTFTVALPLESRPVRLLPNRVVRSRDTEGEKLSSQNKTE